MILLNDRPIEWYSVPKLFEMASPSHCDPTNNSNFEISSKNANIVFTPQFWEKLESIKCEISEELYYFHPIELEFNKINLYGKGGSFKFQDIHDDDVVGLLIVFLPTYTYGGDFVISAKCRSHEVLYSSSWSSKSTSCDHGIAAEYDAQWFAFYPERLPNVFVKEIDSGFRASLTFYVKKPLECHRDLVNMRANTSDWVRGIIKLRMLGLIHRIIAMDYHI